MDDIANPDDFIINYNNKCWCVDIIIQKCQTMENFNFLKIHEAIFF
jgi:hypothetical protein